MKYFIKITSIAGLFIISQLAYSAPITDSYTTGDTLTATTLNNIKSAVNNNDADITSLITDLNSAYRYTAVYFSSANFSTSFGAFGSEVMVATCPTGSLLVGGGVQCSTDSTNFSTTNFGVVNATIPVGNSIIGACYAEALTYSSVLNGPGITARAVCLSPAIIPAQRAAIISSDGVQRSPGQGEPSSEALSTINKMIADSATRVTAVGR